jgi:hypothetical protein
MRRFLALLFLAVLAVTASRAQSAHWENSDSGDPAELQLIFQDCAPDGNVRLPAIPGVTLTQTGTSTQTSIVNFSISRSFIVSYNARAQQPGSAVRIPEFTIPTTKGPVRVPAFTGGAARSAADVNVTAKLWPGATTAWAGEVFPVTYLLEVSRRNASGLAGNLEWNSAPLVTEDWAKPEPTETTVNGDPRTGLAYRTRGYAKTPGSLTLNSASILVNIQTGSVGFGLFQQPRMEQVNAVSNRPEILIRALPSPAPAGFSGAVGQLKFTSKVVPATAGVGEPVTWTVELTGTANWPDIAGLPQRDVSKDFQVISPQAKRTPTDGKLFDVTLTEDVVLIPTRPGSYTLGPLAFTYFDPKSGGYKTLTTPATTVTITPAPPSPLAGSQSPTAANAENTPASSQISNPKSQILPPAAPAGIPRDALPGSATVPAPFSPRTVFALVVAPFVALLAFWAWLALRRARQTDPLRPQRAARLRLAATLAGLRRLQLPTSNFDSQQQRELLLRWQHDAALLWQIPHAAPPASAFLPPNSARPPVPGTPNSEPGTPNPEPGTPNPEPGTPNPEPNPTSWSALWAEADRTLYGAKPDLPADWPARAEAALEAKTLRAFSPLRLFLPRNLLPFLFTLATLLTLVPFAHAVDPAAAYRSGDFPAAEKIWRETLAAHPTDAIARHNLSLALAQQDRWGEAAAHAAAAFVHDPSSEPIRWQLALAGEKAGFVPGPLAGFLPPGPAQSVARLASPAHWQLALGLAALVACTGLGLLLFAAYGRTTRLRLGLALGALGAGLLLGAAAAASLHAYGETADRRAVIVWREGVLRSIPTEADTTQKTTALAPGSLAIVTKSFLEGRWLRLEFANGQTGWVRREELVALWK